MLKQRGELGPKDQIAVGLVRIKHRLLTDAVASEKKRFLDVVPDGEMRTCLEETRGNPAVFIVKMENASVSDFV